MDGAETSDSGTAIVEVGRGYHHLLVLANTRLEPGAWQDELAWAEANGSPDAEAAQVVAAAPRDWALSEQQSISHCAAQLFAAGELELCWRLGAALVPILELRADVALWADVNALTLRAATDAGSRLGRGVALHHQGRLDWIRNSLSTAERALRSAVEIFTEQDEQVWAARTQRLLGGVLAQAGRGEQAHAVLDRALATLRAEGSLRWYATTLRTLGELHQAEGRPAEALACYRACLPVFHRLRDERWVAVTQRSVGQAQLSAGRGREAVTALTEALHACRRIGDRREEALVLIELGRAYAGQAQHPAALDHLRLAHELLNEIGDERNARRARRARDAVGR